MPLYEFLCSNCQKKFAQRLSYAEYDNATVCCPACSSADVRRCIERVRVAQGDRARLGDYSASLGSVDDDPRALGRMMRGMKEQSGQQADPLFNEVVGRLEKGESVQSIDKDYD